MQCKKCLKIITNPRHNQIYCSSKCRISESARRWREKNPDYPGRYARKNKNKISTYCKKWRTKRRKKFIEMYGGKCSCCGENFGPFLTLDHVKNNGCEVRKGRSNDAEYTKAINECRPDLYQILCANCNSAKEWYGECPC